jgi:hypothetical protein
VEALYQTGKVVVVVCVMEIYHMEVMVIMRNGRDSKMNSRNERKKPKEKSKHNVRAKGRD